MIASVKNGIHDLSHNDLFSLMTYFHTNSFKFYFHTKSECSIYSYHFYQNGKNLVLLNLINI